MTSLDLAAVVRLGGADNALSPGCAGGSRAPRSMDAVRADLVAARSGGAALVVFVGGEPTLRPELPRLLRLARSLGLAAGLATNGRTLLYPALRARLLAADLRFLRVALHSDSAAVHDRLVGVAGAFRQTAEGLRALLEAAPASLHVDVACTVTAANLTSLAGLVDLVASWRCTASLSLRFVAPLADSPPGCWPPAALAGPAVAAALDRATSRYASLGLAWEGFPPCLLPAHSALRDERLRYGCPAYGPAADGPSFPREDAARLHPFPCQECRHEATCPGAPPAFLAYDGEDALRPTQAVRANSFNFELVRPLPGFRVVAGDCSARALAFGSGPLRSLLLVSEEGDVSLYESTTGDFSDSEIRRVKDDLRQVYLDPSASATLFDVDFTSIVRRTRPHPECVACPDRPVCCGAVVVDPRPPFAVAEATLRREVGLAAGRVLDVGCGEQPYAAELAAAVRAGRVEYHGLDPDAQALAAFRAKGVGGALHHGTIEAFEAPAASFDVVLAFRSLNHFRDLPLAFGRIARLLRPGGTLVLCDAAPFAMLRTPRQVAFADSHAPHGHEHFRNWTSWQAISFLERFPFVVEEHRPVAPDHPAEWFLRLRRRPD